MIKRTLASINYGLEHINVANVPSNLTKDERVAVKRLTENEDLVISKADKGDVMVVMSTANYLEMA